jgi:uncharacterized coiled-coil DUF342 family protein
MKDYTELLAELEGPCLPNDLELRMRAAQAVRDLSNENIWHRAWLEAVNERDELRQQLNANCLQRDALQLEVKELRQSVSKNREMYNREIEKSWQERYEFKKKLAEARYSMAVCASHIHDETLAAIA